jgi:hypothetical protein
MPPRPIEGNPEFEAQNDPADFGVEVERAEPVEDMDECRRRWEERDQRERSLIGDFVVCIPAKVQKVVAPFATRHWHLLSMAARCDPRLDLLGDNPALGFAMASCWCFCGIPSGQAMRWIRKMISRRRRDIAGALGFPKRETTVRVLSKLSPDACCIGHLLSRRHKSATPGSRRGDAIPRAARSRRASAGRKGVAPRHALRSFSNESTTRPGCTAPEV